MGPYLLTTITTTTPSLTNSTTIAYITPSPQN